MVHSYNAAEPYRQGFIDAILFLTNAILPVCRPMLYIPRRFSVASATIGEYMQ